MLELKMTCRFITAYSPETFEKRIQEALDEGFKPHENFTVTEERLNYCYHILMIKDNSYEFEI